MESVKDNQSAGLELLDLRDYPMPLYSDSNEVKNRAGKHPNQTVEQWLEKVSAARGFVIITPEYNHSYSSVLKNAIDYGYKQWNGKPVGFVAYGGYAGGSRAAEHLRQVAAELQMYDIRDQVLIPTVWQAFDEKGVLVNGDFHAKNANAMVDKLGQLAGKL